MSKRVASSSVLHSVNDTTHYFAVRVKRILTLSAVGVNLKDKDAKGDFQMQQVMRQTNFLNTLMNSRDERITYDLRMVSFPDAQLFSRGRIEMALLCRASDFTANEAQRYAYQLQRVMEAKFEEFVFEIAPQAELEKLLNPFPIRHVSAITRRLEMERLDMLSSGKRRARLGFDQREKTVDERVPKHATVCHLFPFVPTYATMNMLFKLMLLEPQPLAISCRLRPTKLNAEEASFLQEQIARCQRCSRGIPDSVDPDEDSLQTVLSEQAKIYLQYQVRLFSGLRDNAALMTVEIASPEPIPAPVADTLGALITPPAGGIGGPREKEFHTYLSGGYEVVNQSNARVIKSFQTLDLNITPHPLAPKHSERLLYLFDSVEASAALRFPPSTVEPPPGFESQTWRNIPPPKELPDQGCLLGVSQHGGTAQFVRMGEEDRRRHTYLIGQTGTGKTTMLKTMIVDDVLAGNGLCVIDPHGDLVDAILEHVPEKRAKDVIVFNPGTVDHPLGLNMLEYDFGHPEQKTFIVNEMQAIFNRLFDRETMGPMFEQYMRNALLLLMEDALTEPATLMEVPRVFTDTDFRERKLQRITNPIVMDFWRKVATRAGGEASLANMTPYIVSKFDNFIANDYVRPIIGQTKSAFNFRKVMDEGKILLVNLSKGRIGDINARLLGMVIVGKLLMASLSRVDMPQEKRRDFYLYMDEFQNFSTDSIATILSEARKYRLNLMIAHQFIDQLTDEISAAVFGNVGSMLVFRVGATDAEFLEKQLQPALNSNDLINLHNFNAYGKLLIQGQITKPFNFQTIPMQDGNSEMRKRLEELSASTYGRKREEVEKEILIRLRS